MESLPLVSIALCTYNGERFLAQQLNTLISQTYKNLEIIVVDDCSVDNTFSILTDYASKHDNIHLYKNEYNKGFLKNFEEATLYCKGDFIAFCDQDDLWHPQKIELQVAAIGDNMFIYHDSEFIDDNDQPLGKKMSDVFNFYRGGQSEVFLFNNCVSGHAMLIRRGLLKYAFPLKENYYHDWWLAYVATNIGTIDFIPQCLVQYRQHEESNTDLLNLNKVKKNERNNLPITKKLLLETRWLEHCLNYPHHKNPEFIKKLYKLYIGRFDTFTSIRYWQFLKQNMDVLFYIKKESRERKLKQIKKYIWGLRGKNFWYGYIRQDPEKVFHYESEKG